MRFIIIDPRERRILDVEAPDANKAKEMAGLGEVDHGLIKIDHGSGLGLSIIVDEFGLMEPDKHHHFSINGRLYAGTAVLYAHEFGETIDIDPREVPAIEFLGDKDGAASAIARFKVDQPAMSVNGTPVWKWGQPKPERFRR